MTTIAVVGSLNVDTVVRLDRFARAGETVTGRSLDLYPGGKGANQAYAAARLLDIADHSHPGAHGRASDPVQSTSVSLFGQVGADGHAAWLKDNLKTVGVDVTGVGSDPSVSSGIAIIGIDATGQNQIVIVPGANGSYTPDRFDRCADTLARAHLILLQLEIPIETVARAAQIGRSAGAIVILDPAPARPLPQALLASIDFLTPNESELAVLLGQSPSPRPLSREEATAGARTLRDRGVRNVIVKMGGAGALLATEAGELFVAAFPVDVVDTTAAGDAFNAGFAVALAERRSAADATRFAAAVAALSVTRKGAQPSMPTRAEVEALLRG